MRIVDEEWAVISSSSDMEDEQSTTSSSGEEIYQSQTENAGNSISSIRTLKLPTVTSVNDSFIVLAESSPDKLDASTKNEKVVDSSNANSSNKVNSKIDFFESINLGKPAKDSSGGLSESNVKIKEVDKVTETKRDTEPVVSIKEITPVTVNKTLETKLDEFLIFILSQLMRRLLVIQAYAERYSRLIKIKTNGNAIHLFYIGFILTSISLSVSYYSFNKPSIETKPLIWESLIYKNSHSVKTKYYFWKIHENTKVHRLNRILQLAINKFDGLLRSKANKLLVDSTKSISSSVKATGIKCAEIVKINFCDIVKSNGFKRFQIVKSKGLRGLDTLKILVQDNGHKGISITQSSVFKGFKFITGKGHKGIDIVRSNGFKRFEAVKVLVQTKGPKGIGIIKSNGFKGFNVIKNGGFRGFDIVRKSGFKGFKALKTRTPLLVSLKSKGMVAAKFFHLSPKQKPSWFAKAPVAVSHLKHGFDEAAYSLYSRSHLWWNS